MAHGVLGVIGMTVLPPVVAEISLEPGCATIRCPKQEDQCALQMTFFGYQEPRMVH